MSILWARDHCSRDESANVIRPCRLNLLANGIRIAHPRVGGRLLLNSRHRQATSLSRSFRLPLHHPPRLSARVETYNNYAVQPRLQVRLPGINLPYLPQPGRSSVSVIHCSLHRPRRPLPYPSPYPRAWKPRGIAHVPLAMRGTMDTTDRTAGLHIPHPPRFSVAAAAPDCEAGLWAPHSLGLAVVAHRNPPVGTTDL